MTSLPTQSHSVGNCFKQTQKHAAGIGTAGSTIFAGGGHGNNGLTAGALTIGTTGSDPAITHDHHGLRPVKTSATAGGAGFDGNHIDPARTRPGSYERNGFTLPAGSPRPETGAANPGGVNTDGNGLNSNLVRSSNVVHATTAAINAEYLQVSSSLDLKASMKTVRYRECLKNHAASLGGHANDGCGEFMPSGVEGTIEALKCAACSCHRNFHRREVEGEGDATTLNCRYGSRARKRIMEPFFPSPLPFPAPPGLRIHPRPALPSSQMIMALNYHDSDDYEGGLLCPQSPIKKRFRTKFTAEQKEQMGIFAEKLGWRMQKHDDAAVQQFCREIGVNRHVLKVWMHNNKHGLGKKILAEESANPSTQEEEMRA